MVPKRQDSEQSLQTAKQQALDAHNSVQTAQRSDAEISTRVGSLFSISEGLQFAQELAKFIKQQNLTVRIRSSDYVKVEGWQFAGINFGIVPIVKSVTRVDAPGTMIKYTCEVDLLRIATDQVVGHGCGVCSTEESTKRTFEEYAIASMAQTRAIGKAYRNLFAWLVKAAGFEPTPAEEMDEIIDTVAASKLSDVQLKAKSKAEKRKARRKAESTESDSDDDDEDDDDNDNEEAKIENVDPSATTAPTVSKEFELVLS